MKLATFTTAHPFPKGSDGEKFFNLIVSECRARQIQGNLPKMGPHATIFPPFHAPEEAGKFGAIQAKGMWLLFGRERKVTVYGLDFFPPTTSGGNIWTLYAKLAMPKEYWEHIERHKANYPYPYVYPPAQTHAVERVWTPHISILEGDNLNKQMESCIEWLNELANGEQITLTEPLTFQKKEDLHGKRWEQVVV